MKPRERVLKAFRKMDGMPDRVPVQFDLCKNLLEHFGKKLGIPVNYTDNLYEDVTYRISANEIRTAMGSDVVITGAANPSDFKPVIQADAEDPTSITLSGHSNNINHPTTALYEQMAQSWFVKLEPVLESITVTP